MSNRGLGYSPIIFVVFSIILLYIASSTLSTGEPKSVEVELPEFNFKMNTYTIRATRIPRLAWNYTLPYENTREAPLKPPQPTLLEKLLELILSLLNWLYNEASKLVSKFVLKPVKPPEVEVEKPRETLKVSGSEILIFSTLAFTVLTLTYLYLKSRKRFKTLVKPTTTSSRMTRASSLKVGSKPTIDILKLKSSKSLSEAIIEAFKIIYSIALEKLSADESNTHREIAKLYDEVGLGDEAKVIVSAFEKLRFRRVVPKKTSLEEILSSTIKIVERLK